MDPELMRAFCEVRAAETNPLRAGATGARVAKEAGLAKIRRGHRRLVDAIQDDMPAEQVKNRMMAL